MAQLSPAKQGAEAGIPDGAEADVRVMVDVGAGGGTAVVEVYEAKSSYAHDGVELAQGPTDATRSVESVAGGVGVAGVEADADPVVPVEEIEEVCEIAPFAAHLGSSAGGVLEQETDPIGRAGEEGFQAGGDTAEAAGSAGSHVVAEVEHDTPSSQKRRASHVVGDAPERAFPERPIGGSEVHEVAGVDDER